MPGDDDVKTEVVTTTTTTDATKTDTGGGDSSTTDTGDKGGGGDTTKTASTATSMLDRDDDDDAGDTSDTGDTGDKSGADKTEKAETGKGAFPDNWRETLAKGDSKLLDRLKRYASYEAFAQAGLSAQDKIRTGEFKLAKPDENATPEEIKAFREANEIPEDAAKYDIPAVPGHTWTEADEPVLNNFKEEMHKLNVPQSVMSGVTAWYVRTMQASKEYAAEQRSMSDRAHLEELDDALRTEYGADFKPSLKLAKRYLADGEAIDPVVAEALSTARDNNGRRLINNPAVVRYLVSSALDRYGEGALITGSERTSLNSRKTEIEKIRNEDIRKYYDEGLDKELLEINKREAASGRRR